MPVESDDCTREAAGSEVVSLPCDLVEILISKLTSPETEGELGLPVDPEEDGLPKTDGILELPEIDDPLGTSVNSEDTGVGSPDLRVFELSRPEVEKSFGS